MAGPDMTNLFKQTGDKQQRTLNIRIQDLKIIVCDKCKGRVFLQAVEMRYASALECGVPGGKNLTFPVMICMQCKHPHFTVPQPSKEDLKNG